MSRGSKRQDALRLRAILQLLTEPFDDPEMDYLTAETKLWYALRPQDYPIYRRKILKTMPVHGLWWMNESQWLRFLWQGHNNAQVIKSGQDPDRVLAVRSFEKGFCYIRECGDQIDLEARSQVQIWDAEKKRRKGAVEEWLTVSVTREGYKKLDNYLAPIDDGCRHKEYKCDYPS